MKEHGWACSQDPRIWDSASFYEQSDSSLLLQGALAEDVMAIP